MENRVEALEIKVSYQDDVIDTLNKRIIEQQGDIDLLQRRLKLVEGQLQALLPLLNERPEDEPLPPHY